MNVYKVTYKNSIYKETFVAENMLIVANKAPNAAIIELIEKDVTIIK